MHCFVRFRAIHAQWIPKYILCGLEVTCYTAILNLTMNPFLVCVTTHNSSQNFELLKPGSCTSYIIKIEYAYIFQESQK